MTTKTPSLKESDVFISYGRAESKHFAQKLYARLTQLNFEVWFDQNDIPLAVDFQTQIDEGIIKAKNFVFIIAPHSLKSEYCLKEINLAIQYNKRIIPILHVEPSTKEVWDKMHPVISKLNWIYCREKFEQRIPIDQLLPIDDFEKGYNSIIELLNRNLDYVTMHRDILIKSVAWDRNQRNKELLLSGKLLVDAEKWLKTEFKDQQAPCTPVDIQCEFITEAKEAINNNYTDAFLSYSKENIDFVKKVYLKLIRKAYTVWAKDFDLEAGMIQEEITLEAIEKASNFIIFISNKSLVNTNNINELKYALRLNKRIIPIKIDDIGNENLPEEIQKLYHLNFFDKNSDELEKEIGKILNVIDKNYLDFDLHKTILVKAITWEKNNYEIKYLLTGFDLELALDWSDKSFKRKEYIPTNLQSKFIDESKKSRITAFISYARNPSKEFATQLYNQLTEKNYDIWFDQNNIPLAVDFQEQINKGIEKSDNFIFIISPNSIASKYCRIEIELAVEFNKRIIPILHILPDDVSEMHPTISKLNWIYFRENIDNFENSLKGLTGVLDSHTSFVKQHTILLNKAVKWTKNQKSEKYLLEGHDFTEAYNWLLTKFESEQPPCTPNSLQCDYISKSKKYINNHMTDVFFCYDEQDLEFRNKLYYTLAKEGITCSDNKDFSSDVDFIKANHEAIEKSDNVLFIVSPQSVKTEYCLEEISHALIFNKRILILMIEQINISDIFEELQNLNFIDFTDISKFDIQKDKLLSEINKDKTYFFYHKLFLNYAFEWKKQNTNTALLLSGYELEKAKLWLEEGETRDANYPTPLHSQYIKKSIENEIYTEKEIYISYSDHDFDFANKLNYKFKIAGKSTWFDRVNIPANQDYNEELKNGINNSNNCLFIISEQALKNKHLKIEYQSAYNLNKKIITLLLDKANKLDLPIELNNFNILEINKKNTDFNLIFTELLRIIDVDREYLQIKNKWQKRADEWNNSNKNIDLLLRGTELQIAQDWVSNSIKNNKEPLPSLLIKDLIEASSNQQRKEKRRENRVYNFKRIVTFLMGFLFLISTLLGFIVNKQRKIAKDLLIKSNIQRIELLAEDVSADDPTIALRIAQSGLNIDSLETTTNLINDFYKNSLFYKNIIKSDAPISSFDYCNSTGYIAIGNSKIISIYNENYVLNNQLVGHEMLINKVVFSKNGKNLLSCSDDGTVILWDTNGGILKRFECNSGAILSVKYLPDENYFLTGGSDYSAKLWDFDGNLIQTLEGHNNAVWDVAFSPDGQQIATASFDYTAKLWNLEGRTIQTFEGHENILLSIDFSPNGNYILTTSDDNKAIIWNLDGSIFKTLEIPASKINYAKFSPSGYKIITSNNNNTVTIWSLNGEVLATLKGHSKNVYYAIMSENEDILFSCSEDNTLKKWYIDGLQNKFFETKNQIKTMCSINDSMLLINDVENIIMFNINSGNSEFFARNNSLINCIAISSDKKYVLSGDCNSKAYLYNISGKLIKELTAHEDIILDVEFTPDSKNFFTVSQDFVILYWNINGEILNTFSCNSTVLDIEVTPDGKYFLTTHEDKSIVLWDINGKALKTIRGHLGIVNCIAISPDGKYFASGGYDNLIKIWDLEGNPISSINYHTELITDLTFTNDSKYLVSSSKDKLCGLWDLNGTCLNIYNGNSEIVEVVDIVNNYGFISASKNGEIKIFDLKSDLTTFLNSNEIQELSTSQKIEYRIIEEKELLDIENENTIIEVIDYYENKAVAEVDNYNKLENQYKAYNYLENFYSDNKSNDSIRIILSETVNTLSYYCILNQKFNDGLEFVQDALKMNENLTIAYSNLALGYLMTGETEEALRIYKQFMNDNFDETVTFKQVFKADLMNLEQNGIYSSDFEQIYKLLY